VYRYLPGTDFGGFECRLLSRTCLVKKIFFSTEVHISEFFVPAADRRTCYMIGEVVSKYISEYFVAEGLAIY
jgi:hypothetical protein